METKKDKGHKEYLKQIPRLDKTINMKLEQIEELRSLAEKITAEVKHIKSQNKKSYQADRVSGIVAKIVDLNAEINADVDRLVDLKAEAIKLIDKVENPEHKLLLSMRYVSNYTFEKIAVEMNYCYRWVLTLHGRALDDFEKVYKKKSS